MYGCLGVNDCVLDEMIQEALHLKRKNILAYRKKFISLRSIPRLWLSTLIFKIFINYPMHLLFLGILKDVVNITRQVLGSFQKATAFMQYINPILSAIKKSNL